VVGSAALDSTGVATFTPSSPLPAGNFSFIATYSGDAPTPPPPPSLPRRSTAEGFNMTVTPSSVTVAATRMLRSA